MSITSDSELFSQTVPVFSDFAPRIVTLVEIAERENTDLDARLAPDTFNAGEHFVVAQGFILRTIFPVLERDCPQLSTEEPSPAGIVQRHSELIVILGGIGEHDFADANAREISHVVGEAQVAQCSSEYIQLYGLPNFFFHLTMGYASLRAAGAKVGKAQFDGLHYYSPGFSFND